MCASAAEIARDRSPSVDCRVDAAGAHLLVRDAVRCISMANNNGNGKSMTLSPWKRPDEGSLEAYHRYLEQLRCSLLISGSYDGGGTPGPEALTMIGLARLDNFRAAVEHVVTNQIRGDIIECGVWRGGACIFARGVLNAMVDGLPDLRRFVGSRRVFAADSFQGLPPPDVERYPADVGSQYHSVDWLRVSQKIVRGHFVRLNLLDDLSVAEAAKEVEKDRARGVVFLPGFFHESLTEARLGAAGLKEIAVLRLDADMYGSTMQIFEALYDRVTSGGIIIVDDYSGEACSKAVHDFRERHTITSPLQTIDWAGCWWRKD